MTNRNWKDIAELVGITAIVASLLFVGLQMRQEQAIARYQGYSDFNNTMLEYARVINDNRDAWIRGLSGDELTPEEQVSFEVAGFAVYQKFAGLHRRVTVLPGGRTPDQIARQLAADMHLYPGLGNYIHARCSHLDSMGYVPDFCADVLEQYERIESGEYPPASGNIYVL